MSLASLYRICLHRIYRFLRAGVWKFSIPNPFSDLPAGDIEHLMELAMSYDERFGPKIGHVFLLLTSGRLTNFDFCPYYPEREHVFIVREIQKTSSLFLHSKKLAVYKTVRNIIAWNPYLEKLHLNINPGFDVIQMCQNLRILRFFPPRKLSHGSVAIDLSVLSTLKNLEEFYVRDMDTKMIEKVLETCPKLISIGLNNSLHSMEEIAQRRQKNSLLNFDVDSHLQLRRCVWGSRYRIEKYVHASRYCDKIRFAVTLCPLVQELIIYLYYKEAMKLFKLLKRLNLLKINFLNCDDDFIPDFVTLLQEIGPQLKHLSITCHVPVPVDIICECCTHLESLDIIATPFVKDSPKASRNFPLKRLSLYSSKEVDYTEAIMFLLCNCKHLEEMFIDGAKQFDDYLLNQVFERNPFTKLKVSWILYCGLTRKGYLMFKNKAASIEKILVAVSRRLVYHYDVSRLFKDPNLHYLKYVDSIILSNSQYKDFFYYRLNKYRF